MMKNFLIISVAIFIFSCGRNKDENSSKIFGIWTLSESESLVNKKSNSNDELLEEAKKIEEAKKHITLSIFPDKTYTKLCCDGDQYEYGTWDWVKKGERICFSHDKRKEVFDLNIEMLDDSLFQVEYKNQAKKQKFKLQENLFENYKEEPFYVSNNSWRIKALKQENRQEILNRLGNYFKHMTYLLKAADKRDLQVISFEYSLGIVKIYNSGIGIEEDTYIPDNWKNIFYNRIQYEEARNIYKTYLGKDDTSFPASGDWVKDDYTLMLSIYNDLKMGKF
jgi:hypothetical protein